MCDSCPCCLSLAFAARRETCEGMVGEYVQVWHDILCRFVFWLCYLRTRQQVCYSLVCVCVCACVHGLLYKIIQIISIFDWI